MLRGLVWFGAAALVAAQQSQSPVFRSATDVVLVDVQVVSRNGDPVADLAPGDFEVAIGGRSRRVLSVDFVRYSPQGTASGQAPQIEQSGDPRQPRRLYILAVDGSSFSTLAALAWKEAIKRFIERVAPSDLVGLYAYPMGGSLVPLTDDHRVVLEAADRIVGRLDPVPLTHYMTASEMIDITRGEPEVALRVARSECAQTEIMWCAKIDLPREAQAYAREVELRMTQSIGGLRTLMRSLRQLDGRKTVVVVSGGLFAADQVGARGDVSDLITAVGHEATHADINLYVLHLDRNFIAPGSSSRRNPDD